MMKWLLGSIGFVLFIFSDYNTVKWNKKSLNALFWIGSFCVLAGTVMAAWEEIEQGILVDGESMLAVAFACVCGAMLIYTLFFAIPFSESYIEGTDHRKVCKSGMYAFCRHPGVVWFFFFYLTLGRAFQGRIFLWYGVFLSLLNLGYVVFQDYYSFPIIFNDYVAYRKEVPFIIPTKRSMAQGVRTWRKKGEKDAI
ncbi:MAG: hypothetical protein ACOX1S_03825 [Anaerostipes sp.]